MKDLTGTDLAIEAQQRIRAAGRPAVVKYQGNGWYRLRFIGHSVTDGIRLRKDKLIARVHSHEAPQRIQP